ncbi:MAG: secretion protein HlyD, partial [Planctomycetaceae bacterium]|nr:secretion protein HlyD [Planctomycetaceae bacterium]
MDNSMLKQNWKWIVTLVLLVPAGFIAWNYQEQWLPVVQGRTQNKGVENKPAKSNETADAHAGEEHHDHDHAGHDEASSLELSPQARKNIGLTSDKLIPVKLQSFTRTITIPAIVVERPGKTRITIVAPMTGIVMNVNVIAGEAVKPDRELF